MKQEKVGSFLKELRKEKKRILHRNSWKKACD